MTLVIVLLVIGLLVFIHELGHFLVAKLVKMKVEEFAFGFPPKLWSKRGRETKFVVNLLPFGGYVKIFGEDEEETGPGSFSSKGVLERLAVVVAGVVMNFILGAVLLSAGFMIGTLPVVTPYQEFSGSKEAIVVVSSVLPQSSAQKAGLEAGDRLMRARSGGKQQEFASASQVSEFTKANRGKEATFDIGEIGKNHKIRHLKVNLGEGEAPLGVSLIETGIIKLSPSQAIGAGFREAVRATGAIVSFFGQTISGLFRGQGSLDGVAGPVGIYRITADAVQMGWAFLVQLVAVLSINLAVLNILPFPALDGGRLIFIFLEGIWGRKIIKERHEAIVHTIGFVVLLALIALITASDISKLF